MADLTTTADVKAWLNITGNSDDAVIARLVTAVSNYIQSWLNRTFAMATYTDISNGNNESTKMFSNYPVQSVSSVTISGVAIPASADGIAYGYVFDDQSLALIGTTCGRGLKNVRITYTAGYSSVPFEIAQACIELVAIRYRERTRVGEVSKSLGGETVSFTQKDMPDSVRTILNNYKKVISQ